MSQAPSTIAPLLEIDGVGKAYGGTPVLHALSLSLHAGEVLALTGENGAGKSTLSKLICGLERPTLGSLRLAGQPYAPATRQEAERLGVRMVMQELGLVSTLTVAENLFLGRMPSRAGWLRRGALHAAARQQLAKIGLDDIDPATPVSRLGIGQQQMVEIARNLQDDTRVLVLDEPTAMLTPRETSRLFEQIARLTARGVAIVYVSHRLEELRRIADRVAVLRDGRLVDLRAMAGLSEADLVQRMVGRSVSELEHRPRRRAGAVLLRAEGLGRGTVVQGVSLEVRAGEVFGIAGLVGSGRTELLRLLFGADRADSGTLVLNDDAGEVQRRIPRGFASPVQAIAAGIGLVAEDRKSQGLLLSQSIRINATLSDLAAVSRGGWLRSAHEHTLVRGFIERLRVRCRGSEQPVGQLSGGNQQKVVFARWLHRSTRVLLLDEPTRGVDVGARADLYAELDQMACDGRGLLMVSSDLRELMAMADRIGVMSAGRLVAVFERGEWTESLLLSAAFSKSSEPGKAVATESSAS
ncbi:sugar ABC transporter ATP-binding protein [Ideonella azotifigens]|uniref:Sugar ABC transporter ATP-binding protein n=3 Tax=Ideonella azotifigens TaxID=513160 RepID=A0ABN1K1F0_9BURK|nr:sugar ABC transporter ATP-binding protein [Ideonella azotifigens]MCD2341702.1 sugar ABC transporter ATP-binding protein [Ideonella azotifigens]